MNKNKYTVKSVIIFIIYIVFVVFVHNGCSNTIFKVNNSESLNSYEIPLKSRYGPNLLYLTDGLLTPIPLNQLNQYINRSYGICVKTNEKCKISVKIPSNIDFSIAESNWRTLESVKDQYIIIYYDEVGVADMKMIPIRHSTVEILLYLNDQSTPMLIKKFTW